MLLIGAGLLIRSFVRVRDVNPGFNPHNVLTLELTMTGERYKDKTAVLRVKDGSSTIKYLMKEQGYVMGGDGKSRE